MKSNTTSSNKRENLDKKRNNLFIISSLIILLIATLYFITFTNNEKSIKTEVIIPKPKNTMAVNVQTQKTTEQPGSDIESKINELITKANNASDAGNLYNPIKANALYFYLEALKLEPDNKKLTFELNQLHLDISDNLSSLLSDSEFEKAISTIKTIKKEHPGYPRLFELNLPLTRKAKQLISETTELLKYKQYDTALSKLSLAVRLEPEFTFNIKQEEKRILKLIQEENKKH